MKTLATIATLAALTSGAFADGSIQFQNSITTEIYFYNASSSANAATSATIGSQTGGGSGGVLDVGLVWGTSASSVNTIYGGTLAGIENIGTHAGQLAGNVSFLVPGTNPGDVDYFQVYTWDSSFGDSLAGMQACLAAGGYFGASSAGSANAIYGAIGAPLQITLGAGPPAPGTPIFNTSGNVFGKTILLAGPEPATMAIGGLGVAALWLFRRRK